MHKVGYRGACDCRVSAKTTPQRVRHNQIVLTVWINTQGLDLQDLPSKDIPANENEVAIVLQILLHSRDEGSCHEQDKVDDTRSLCT